MTIYIVFDGLCNECGFGEILGTYLSQKAAKEKAVSWAQTYVDDDNSGCRVVITEDGFVEIRNAQDAYLFYVPVVAQEVQ